VCAKTGISADVLQLEEQVWRSGSLRTPANQGTGSRAPRSSRDVSIWGWRITLERIDHKKALNPVERREALHWLVEEQKLAHYQACGAELPSCGWYRPALEGRLRDQELIEKLNK